MAFPDSFVDEVRRASDIVRVISEHVALRKVGNSWKGLCPFHHEKTPSFNVRQEPAVFHCFGCGEGGDVFKFLMLHERVSFPEAVETAARRAGIAVPDDRYEAGPDRKEREQLLALLEAAAEHYQQRLWTPAGTKAREYLLGRGFQKETLERIRAGAAADAWSDLLDSLSKRFPVAALVTAGLVLPKQNGNGHYDRFRNRAVFPILNESGKVVGFGARSLDGSEPKYLNSPESPVYQKSRLLYGLSWGKEAIRSEGRIVLMEGYLDVARAIEAGVGCAVATCGTALTGGHARLLRRFAERVVVNFDQDEAGQKAARKSLAVLAEEGLKVQVVELPNGEDPDSYLKSAGSAPYRQRLDEAPEGMEWLIRQAMAQNDVATPSGKGGYLAALLPALVQMESPVERAAWLAVAVERGRLDERAARQELARALDPRGRETRPSAHAPSLVPAPARTADLRLTEKTLLALLVKEAEGVAEALVQLEEADLQGLRTETLLRAAQELARAGERLTSTSLAAALEAEADRRLVSEMAVDPIPTERVTPGDCVREMKCWPLEARIAEIQKELPRTAGPAQDVLLAEHLRLKQLIATMVRSMAMSH